MKRHAIVLAQRPIKLGATHIDRNNCGGAALEQAIGKAAGRAAHIQTGKARRIDVKRIKRAFELKTAAANVRDAPLHVQRQARGHLKTRRSQALAATRDQAGHKSAKGIRAIGADAL